MFPFSLLFPFAAAAASETHMEPCIHTVCRPFHKDGGGCTGLLENQHTFKQDRGPSPRPRWRLRAHILASNNHLRSPHGTCKNHQSRTQLAEHLPNAKCRTAHNPLHCIWSNQRRFPDNRNKRPQPLLSLISAHILHPQRLQRVKRCGESARGSASCGTDGYPPVDGSQVAPVVRKHACKHNTLAQAVLS